MICPSQPLPFIDMTSAFVFVSEMVTSYAYATPLGMQVSINLDSAVRMYLALAASVVRTPWLSGDEADSREPVLTSSVQPEDRRASLTGPRMPKLPTGTRMVFSLGSIWE